MSASAHALMESVIKATTEICNEHPASSTAELVAAMLTMAHMAAKSAKIIDTADAMWLGMMASDGKARL